MELPLNMDMNGEVLESFISDNHVVSYVAHHFFVALHFVQT